MKSTHNKAEQQVPKEIKFPCLMVANDGDVVLFSEPKAGMKVVSVKYSYVGHYSKDWDMSYFTPLPPTESITLSND